MMDMMEIFQKVVYFLAFASLGITVTRLYLKSNKLWMRKHEKTVAESISVTAEILGLLPESILVLNFILERQWQGMISSLLYISLGVFYILIGIKLWVEGERKKGFLRLFIQAFQQEKQEAGNLAKSFLKPSGAKTVINILCQIALIDDVLDPREKEFIQSFADNWDIYFDWDELKSNRTDGSPVNYVKLRQDLADYLATYPPSTQVCQLQDVIAALVNIDDDFCEEEQLIVGEFNGLFSLYLGQQDDLELYHVVVVPKGDRDSEAIATKFPELSPYPVANGLAAYNSGPFYSKKYAQIICEQYRSLDLFGLVVASLPA